MCQLQFDARLAPIQAAHLDVIGKYYSDQLSFSRDIFRAWTDGLCPALTVVATLAVMREYLQKGWYGLLREFKAIRFPLSLVANDIRYRTPLLDEAHEAFLSAAMAEKNVSAADKVAQSYGVRVFRTCSCAMTMVRTKDADNLISSDFIYALDAYRSSLDRMGCPVWHVNSVAEVPSNNIDLTIGEERLFQDIDNLIKAMVTAVPWDEAAFRSAVGIDKLREDLGLYAQQVRNSSALAKGA